MTLGPGRLTRQRKLAGRDARRQVDAGARTAGRRRDGPAQRRRAERGEQDIGAGLGCGHDAVAELVEELGEDLVGSFRGGRGSAGPHQLDRIARQSPVFQPGVAYEPGETVVGRQRHLMPRLPQPLPQPRERRDITARAGRDDQNPHVSRQ
nr:hypothetical protein [Actinoplanes solisilvae]